jgi:hypothetical protein
MKGSTVHKLKEGNYTVPQIVFETKITKYYVHKYIKNVSSLEELRKKVEEHKEKARIARAASPNRRKKGERPYTERTWQHPVTGECHTYKIWFRLFDLDNAQLVPHAPHLKKYMLEEPPEDADPVRRHIWEWHKTRDVSKKFFRQPATREHKYYEHQHQSH